ncbi:MAG: TetR/AcrR family transcriptional regulator [Clostridiales bacterium]|nr:TetR/AcrR family transcriptional regulator [Clostridiales bacterium]
MQYKKDEVRDRILAAARNEFLTRGYRGGNISAIAEAAGVPIGNLYRYFAGKSGVLDALVRPVYEAVPRLMTELQQVETLDSVTLTQIMPMLSGGLLSFFDAFGDDILILMDCCDGTRYDDFSKDLTRQVARIMRRKLYPEAHDDQQDRVAEIVSKAFCGSLFDVLRMRLSHDQKQDLVERLLKFYFYEIDKRK